ncbi:MAG: response regulator [Candidatus Eisenbacteria bacterium]|nr:response regulator [Candidatus Eisenbacteria bacterium]
MQSEGNSGRNKRGRTILLVDDDEDFLELQRMRLEADGFEVLAAVGEKQAEELLAKRQPDLAVLDLMMEQMDAGFVLSYRIKKQHPMMPVILVTGVTSETGIEFDATTHEERSWMKVDAVLTKPVRYEQLRGEIDRLLKG